MGWSLSDLGIAGFTLVGVVPALIVIGVIFAVGGVALYLSGLVSAMIYLLAGVGFIWMLKLFGVFKNPLGYLFLLVLPAMFFWGWGVDHLTFLSMMPNPANWLASQPMITLSTNDLNGSAVTFLLNWQNFGALMSTLGAVFGVTSILLVTRKKKRRSH